MSVYIDFDTITYFDSFGTEYIRKEILKFIERNIDNKNIIANIVRTQAYDSIICGYFCIRFIYFMFKGNSLRGFTNLFLPNDFKENDDKILTYFLTNL